jgi:hypothetical protein
LRCNRFDHPIWCAKNDASRHRAVTRDVTGPVSPPTFSAATEVATPPSSRFVRGSIAVKFFGVVVVLLLLMALAAAISMWQAQNVASLFESVTDSYMPAYASLTRANVRSLEEALLIRRVVIARQNGSSASAADRDAVLAKGKTAAESVARAQQLIGSQIASGNTLGDEMGLMRLNTRLEFLQRDLERVQVQDATLLADMMATGDEDWPGHRPHGRAAQRRERRARDRASRDAQSP